MESLNEPTHTFIFIPYTDKLKELVLVPGTSSSKGMRTNELRHTNELKFPSLVLS